jgi:predicted RNA-binding protein (virulence factor B family)
VRANRGFLPVNDNSAPEAVMAATQMSKKVFKRSLGVLLKRGDVEMVDEGIKLK